MNRIPLVALMVLAVLPVRVVLGDEGPLDAVLMQRAADVQKLFAANSDGYDKLFAPAFRKEVPDLALAQIFKKYFTNYGAVSAVKLREKLAPGAGKFTFTFAKGFTAPVTVAVDSNAPHKITGLWIGLAVRSAGSIEELMEDLGAFPGTTSFCALRLDGPSPQPVAIYNADKPLAIGSTFKLYVLAELVREIHAQKRHWDDVVRLQDQRKSLPPGGMARWPAGSPVTLHTLAVAMISQSDNTAADHLLYTLGRKNVESILKVTGNSAGLRNEPFLSTAEMFKLKYTPRLAEQYFAADLAGRRAMLANQIASIDLRSISVSPQPRMIDRLEWFASTEDLCHVMKWLWQNTARPPTDAARAILSINPGLDVPANRYDYVGYKGGSEAGVLNLTFLLHARSGHWYAVSATWNDPQAAVETGKLTAIMEQAFRLLPR